MTKMLNLEITKITTHGDNDPAKDFKAYGKLLGVRVIDNLEMTHGQESVIEVACNNVERAIYHLGLRGLKFKRCETKGHACSEKPIFGATIQLIQR